MIEQGIYPDLSNEDYHNDSAISRSGIKLFCESPYKYWAEYLNPARPAKKTTDAMEFGSALHAFILEHETFHKYYVIEPKKVLLKDVGRDEYEDYKLKIDLMKSDNRIVLSCQEWDLLTNMKLALQNHEQAWDLIEGAQYEQSYFWRDEHSGLMVKCRPDILRENCIIDLKTCASADSRTYQKTMYLDALHIQGAMCREGVKQLTGFDIPTVINICVEKTYPYQVAIKIISHSALEAGHMKFKQALLDMKACIADNKWSSYEPEEVDLPAWAN